MGELAPGSTVAGKYTLIERAGRGGMGDVWIARNEATAGEVAIKTLRADRRTIEGADARFRQEARVSAKLAHPNVARVYDLVEEKDGTLMLVMERLRGETLKTKLQNGPLDEQEVVRICIPILEGLGAAHAAGIIHRDVTPGNIFLAEEGGRVTPKLIDFGVAKADDTITTKAGHALGTPQYMSPEQIRCHTLDGRSDLFSLAVTIFEAISGSNPFRCKLPSGSLAAVLETDVDPDPKISPALWLVLSRTLAKQPYERPANAKELKEALERVIGPPPESEPKNEPLSAHSADLSGQIDVPPPEPKRPPWGLIAAACALAVVVVLGAVTLARKEKPVAAIPSASPQASVVATSPPSSTPPSTQASAQASVAAVIAPRPTTTAPATGRPAGTKPAGSTRVKAVATTPGF